MSAREDRAAKWAKAIVALKAVEAGQRGGIWWLDSKGIPRFKGMMRRGS